MRRAQRLDPLGRNPTLRGPVLAQVLAHVLAAGALLAPPLAGQDATAAGQSRSLLTLLPVQREVQVGTELSDALESSDYLTVTGVRVEAYRLLGRAGDPVTIDLTSATIDAYLYLIGPGYEDPLTDDDSGGACNARLSVFLPADGPYMLVVGSLDGEPGAYTLRVADRGQPEAEGDCFGEEPGAEEFEAALLDLEIEDTLEVGAPLTGELTSETSTLPDGSAARAWWFLGTPGETLTFDLESEDFDTMLFVLEEEGDGFFADDDGGNGCNSRVTLDVTSAEPYRVVVNVVGVGVGGFTLTLSRDAPPVTSEPCRGR